VLIFHSFGIFFLAIHFLNNLVSDANSLSLKHFQTFLLLLIKAEFITAFGEACSDAMCLNPSLCVVIHKAKSAHPNMNMLSN